MDAEHSISNDVATGILKAVGVIVLLALAVAVLVWGYTQANKPPEWEPTRPTAWNARGTDGR
jgi:hypothetical protein